MLFHANLKEIPASVTVAEQNIRRASGDDRFFLFGVFFREPYGIGLLKPRVATVAEGFSPRLTRPPADRRVKSR